MTAPDSSEEWVDPIFDAVVSEAQACGYFDKVNLHEPKQAPGTGLTAGIWVQRIVPIGMISGLQESSALVVFFLRIYTNMYQEPVDLIDPNMLKAVSNLMRRFNDDFDFGGAIRNVDLFGITGTPLSAEFGYIPMETPAKLYRSATITIPCIVNDVWPQNQAS